MPVLKNALLVDRKVWEMMHASLSIISLLSLIIIFDERSFTVLKDRYTGLQSTDVPLRYLDAFLYEFADVAESMEEDDDA